VLPIVLVVDDEPARLGLTIAMIEECGRVGLGIRNAQAAQRVISNPENDIGLVITDVRMPGPMDGVGLAKWIIESRPDVRVVVTSGFAPDPKAELPEGVIFVPKVWLSMDVLQFFLQSDAMKEDCRSD
jgi:DNA-binding NtrC family response regulator